MIKLKDGEFIKVKNCPNCKCPELAPYEVTSCEKCGSCEFENSEGEGCQCFICVDCGHETNIPGSTE